MKQKDSEFVLRVSQYLDDQLRLVDNIYITLCFLCTFDSFIGFLSALDAMLGNMDF